MAGKRRGASKRLFDLVLGSFLLVLAIPLMVLVALLIRVESDGPILFRQMRVGARLDADGNWQRRDFQVFKFRSMFDGADETRHREYIESFVNGDIPRSERAARLFKLTDDDRVTRVGRVIRRLSIDELPQLFNVLRGEMSLVGPRPVPVYEVEQYADRHMERFHTLPGITGLWQVYGRGRVTFERMIAMDVQYVRTRSFWLDLKLLLATVPAALSGRGAG